MMVFNFLRKRHFSCRIASALVVWVGLSADCPGRPTLLGPIALTVSPDARMLYVACAESRELLWVRLPDGAVLRRVSLPAGPTGVVLDPARRRLVVTCAEPADSVLMLDAESGQVLRQDPAGHGVTGPSLSPDGSTLIVCNRFDGDVSLLDLEQKREAVRFSAVREPIASAMTPDGSTVLVANHLPKARSDLEYGGPVAPVITVWDARSASTESIELPYGSSSLRELCVSPDGRYAFVTHIVSNFQRPPTQLDMGWANLNVLTVIDVPGRRTINTVGLDETYLGAGNPWGVACTADGRTVCVTHAGSEELTVVETTRLLGTLPRPLLSPLVGGLQEAYGSRPGDRCRVPLPGKSPRGLAIAGTHAYVAEYFSDTIAVVDLGNPADAPPSSLALGPEPELTERQRGAYLFQTAKICYQQWHSCASCHPDGRADALNWDLMNDGLGTSKNTKSLLLAHRTPPAMSEGVRASAEIAVRSGISHILFSEQPEDDAVAIDAYLKALEPVPSPLLVDGELSPAARRGQKLFLSTRGGCSRCHPPPLYTDLRMHDVGTRTRFEYVDRFDTPTLVEVWRTAPYLHDGRYLTLRKLLAEGRHGLRSPREPPLSEGELDDLIAFVLSL